ncbi:MAG: hypothetical protein P8N76_26815 [Pirellulaceae bacterium]|nr:hypothetical protein [Pirellulaceae bacterium]
MRIITLLFVASCVMATSVQAQVGKTVVVSHGHNSFVSQDQHADPYAGVNVYGCCEDDVSYCFDLWSTYCNERKPQGACCLRGGCRMAACGCNNHHGIFRNKPCCGNPLGLRHHASDCDSCSKPGCDSGGGEVGGSNKGDPPSPETTSEPSVYNRNDRGLSQAAVGLPSESAKTASRMRRWTLPYKWNK